MARMKVNGLDFFFLSVTAMNLSYALSKFLWITTAHVNTNY